MMGGTPAAVEFSLFAQGEGSVGGGSGSDEQGSRQAYSAAAGAAGGGGGGGKGYPITHTEHTRQALDWMLIGSNVPSHLEIKSVKKVLKERSFLARQPFPLLQFPRLMVPLIAGDDPPVAVPIYHPPYS